jgi:hypothetical protein
MREGAAEAIEQRRAWGIAMPPEIREALPIGRDALTHDLRLRRLDIPLSEPSSHFLLSRFAQPDFSSADAHGINRRSYGIEYPGVPKKPG